MAVELATAYISLVASTDKIPKQVKAALGEAQRGADKIGADIGTKMSGGLTKALKVGALGAGAAVGGVMAGAVLKGMGRLTAIDDAQGKLRGLGHDAKSVQTIMDSALVAVKGTAFGLGDAATVAASAVAAGIKPGENLTKYLSLVGDAASIAGMEMNEMGSIFNKVAASNKIQGDVIAQMADAGIPIVQMLGEELGKSADEVYSLAKKGKINFETFQAAMDKGLGGAALESGNTFKGALKNAGAALGRFGAELMKPSFGRAPKFFGDITKALDDVTPSASNFAKAMDTLVFKRLGADKFDVASGLATLIAGGFDKATDAVEKVSVWADTKLPDIITKVKSVSRAVLGSDLATGSMDRIVGIFHTLAGAAERAGPALLQIGKSVAEASAALGISSWQVFLSVLESAATIADAVLVPALETTANLMRDNRVAVMALIGGFTAFKTIPAMMGRLAPSLSDLQTKAGSKNGLNLYEKTLLGIKERASSASASMKGFGDNVRLTQDYASAAGRPVGVLGASFLNLRERVSESDNALRRMGQAYVGAGAGLRAYSERHSAAAVALKTSALNTRQFETAVDMMGRSAGHSAASGVASFSRSIAGVGSAVGSGLKSALTGVTNVLGGPLNTALMVGAGLLVSWAAGVQQSKAHTKAYEKSLLDVAKAQGDVTAKLLTSGGKVDESIMSNLAGQIEKVKEGFEDLGKNDAKWYNVAGDYMQVASGFYANSAFEHSKYLDQTAQANKDAAAAMDKTGMSYERWAQVLTGSRGNFDVAIDGLRGMGQGGELAADKLLDLRRNFERSEELAKRVTPGFIDINEQFKTMADNFASADAKGDALFRTLQLIAGIDPDLKQATDAMNKRVRDLKEAEVADPSKGAGKELFDDNGMISTVTENGQALSDAVTGAIENASQLVHRGEDVNKVFADLGTVIEETARVFGVEVPKLRETFEKHGLNEEVMRITANLEKASGVAKDFSGIWGGMMLADAKGDDRVLKGIKPEIATEDVRKQIASFGGLVSEVKKDGEVIAFDIELKDEEAWRKANEWVRWQAQVAQFKTDAKLGLDVSSFNTESDQAKQILMRLGELETKPGADLDIAELLGKKEISVEELTKLQDKVTKPEVLLEIAGLLAGINTAETNLQMWLNHPRSINVGVNMVYNPDLAAQRAAAMHGAGIHGPVSGIIGPYADGGFLPDQAKIQAGRGGGLVQWAEGETGGEAFIPLAPSKRGRSTQILADVASRFGYKLQAFADGGIRAAMDAARSVTGNTYVWGGTGPTGFDCSGFVGWLQQIVMGVDKAAAAGKRLYTTYSLLGGATAGLRPGLGPANTAFQVGVSQEHMAATLAGNPVEAGGAHGTSRIGPPAVYATDPQFTHWFHLPNSMVAGGVEGRDIAAYRALKDAREWTDDDEMDLEEARIGVSREQEQLAETQKKVNEGKATQADLDKANLDLRKAQKKVLDLQKQKDAAGMGKYIAPQAPDLAKRFDEEERARLRAQLAVDDANEKRNEVYDDPESSEGDKLRADMDLIEAEEALENLLSGKDKAGRDYSLKGILSKFAHDATDAVLEGALGQVPFGLADSRWVTTDWDSLIPNVSWTAQQVKDQLGVTPGTDDWREHLIDMADNAVSNSPFDPDELRKRLKVYDSGGWLEPGDIGINLSSRPEPIFNSPEQLRRFSEGFEAPEGVGGVDNSIHMGDVTLADVNELIRKIRTMQQNKVFAQVRR